MIDAKWIESLKEFPCVCFGDAVSDFKKYYKGPIVHLENDKDLREHIAYYSGLDDIGRLLVIEDISFITGANTILLKFIEETKLPVVLLSRYDKMDGVLLSRIKHIEKYYRDETGSQFLTGKRGQEIIENTLSENSSYFDRVRYMGKYSPVLFKLEKKIKVKRIRKRIVEFLS